MDMLYEGKAKRVYTTDDDSRYIVEFKDDATAQNGAKKGVIETKGIINNKISSALFEMLESKGIKTHFIKRLSDREMEVRAVSIIPIEVIVRNVAAGSLCSRLGIEEGLVMERPIVELCLKDDSLGDPFINDDHAIMLGLATESELKTIKDSAVEINKILREAFEGIGIRLIDFKLEFGKAGDEVILADEISPDTCRFWDLETGEKLDKDRFRKDMADMGKGYREILKRLSVDKE